MNNKKTKMIVQAGLFVAIYTIFFLIDRYSGGFLESMLFFILPLPLIIFTYSYGMKYALIPFVSIFLIAFVLNPISALFYVLTSSVLGIIYGGLVRKNIKNKYLVIICILVSAIMEIFTSLIFAHLLDYSLNEEIKSIYIFILKIFRISSENEVIMNSLIFATIPLFIFLLAFFEGFATHAIASVVLDKMGIKKNTIGNIYLMRLPIWTSIVYFVLLAIHVITAKFYYVKEDLFMYYLAYVFLELYWFFSFVLTVKGYLFLALTTYKKNFGRIFVLIFFIGMVLIPIPMFIIVSIIGSISVFSDKKRYLLYNE